MTVGLWKLAEGSEASMAMPVGPHVGAAQEAISHVDVPLALLGAAGVAGVTSSYALSFMQRKGHGARSDEAKMVDRLSSRALVDTSAPNRFRKIRDKLPSLLGALGVMAATTFNMVGTEISEGPQRPVATIAGIASETVFHGQPFDTLIVPERGANTMSSTSLSADASRQIMQAAIRDGVNAVPIGKDLGSIRTPDGKDWSSLTFGLPVQRGTNLEWDRRTKNCNNKEGIPVVLDTTATFIPDTGATLNGVPIRVVGRQKGLSAINRVGGYMDMQALAACVTGDGLHAVALQGGDSVANKLIKDSRITVLDEPRAVISVDQYLENSQDFWIKNSKPLTNIIALISMGLISVAAASTLRQRIDQSKPELASLLANGVPAVSLRKLEAMRTVKKMVPTVVAGVISAAPTATAINSIIYGMQTSMTPKDALVGIGTAFSGAALGFWQVFGTKKRIIKSINPAETTR